MASLTVLGIGNILMQDDGVGVRLLEAVRCARDWPAEVEFIDGGAGGLNLLGVIESARQLIVFDAADLRLPPGRHRTVAAAELRAESPGRISLHDMPFTQTLHLCRQFLAAPDAVTILAVQPAQVDHGRELSPALQREFDTLVRAAVALVEGALRRSTGTAEPRGED